jgi:phenylacetate-CoA ligase
MCHAPGREPVSATPWPPTYDERYRPAPADPYWFREPETMAPEQRAPLILAKLRAQMAYAWERAPFYRRKWRAVGLEPGDIKTLEDFRRVPLVMKEEIRKDQEAHPPFGSALCIPLPEVARVHGTSGTTGKPTAFAIGRADWLRIGNAHARIMWSFGLRPTDTLFIGSFFSLYMGSWGALAGAERLGMIVFPFGAGVPGQTKVAIRWIREVQPSVFYGTPSYGLHLAEKAREEGLDPRRDFAFRVLFFSGEPGAGIPATKRQIEETYGGICVDTGSMAEMTPWMTNAECQHRTGMHLWQDLVYTELLHPETREPVPPGGEGVPVYTHLERTSQPMIRLWSGDLATWTDAPCPCGRTYPRLPKGITGRVDDMFIVRGENIYPSTIEDTLRATPGFGGEFRIIISREEAMDRLAIQAEYSRDVAAKAQHDGTVLERLARLMEERLRTAIGVWPRVKLMPPEALARTEFKARRVIDNRDLFRSLRGGT